MGRWPIKVVYPNISAMENNVEIIERHLHSHERWFGVAVAPAGTTHIADQVGVGVVSFQLDAGNNDWGAWLQILGSTDTPIDAGMDDFDLHRLTIIAAERDETYFIQLAAGATGAIGLAAANYNENVFQPLTNQVDSGPVIVQDEIHPSGTMIWARCLCPLQNTATINFFFGLHEYT